MPNDPAFDLDDARQNIALKCLEGKLKHPSQTAINRELSAARRRRQCFERICRKLVFNDIVSANNAAETLDSAAHVQRLAASKTQQLLLQELAKGNSQRRAAQMIGFSLWQVADVMADLRRRAASA